jgi:hypothetical protein
MSVPQKSTIYIDINDEITTVIAKVQEAKHRIVALVLPKRASAFQSVVNMKLLKKASDTAKKKTVLITSEESVLSLAGLAGLHVATTPQSKPFVPEEPSKIAPAVTDAGSAASADSAVDPKTPVGELALAAADKEGDTIDLGDLPDLKIEDESAKKTPKKPKRKLRIPNFNKFRLALILGGLGLILLVVGWYIAVFVMPRADIVLETSTQNLSQTIEFDARTSQTERDTENLVIPVTEKELRKQSEETVPATGEKNVGEKATGTMTLTNCINDGEEKTVPSGTAFSSGNFTFLTTEAVTLEPAVFSGPNCRSNEFGQSENAAVEAQEPGSNYNLSERNYQSSMNGILASGSGMSGGTDEIVNIVSSRDITTARQAIEQDVSTGAQEELAELHDIDGLIALDDTFDSGDPDVSASPEEGQEADEVTVTSSTRFVMSGVSREDLQQLVEASISEEINLDRQAIIDHGLNEASVRVIEDIDGGVRVRLRTIVAVGPDIDVEEVKQSIAGMKRSEAQTELLSREGIRDVQIDYSPFWVFSTPDNPEKIHVTFLQLGLDEEQENAE